MVEEGAAEAAAGMEAGEGGYFGHGLVGGGDQCGCFFEAGGSDHVIGRAIGDRSHFSVEGGPAHVHQLCEQVDVEGGVGEVVGDEGVQLFGEGAVRFGGSGCFAGIGMDKEVFDTGSVCDEVGDLRFEAGLGKGFLEEGVRAGLEVFYTKARAAGRQEQEHGNIVIVGGGFQLGAELDIIAGMGSDIDDDETDAAGFECFCQVPAVSCGEERKVFVEVSGQLLLAGGLPGHQQDIIEGRDCGPGVGAPGGCGWRERTCNHWKVLKPVVDQSLQKYRGQYIRQVQNHNICSTNVHNWAEPNST